MDILSFIILEIFMIALHAFYIADNIRNNITYIHLIILMIIWIGLLIFDVIRLINSLSLFYLC